MSRGRKSIPKILLAGLVLVTASAATVSATSSKAAGLWRGHIAFDGYPDTGFGGETIYSPVHEISAQWQVPKILSSTRIGNASTWIGVQNSAGDFVQLGVTENKDFPSGPNASSYNAFWSSTTEGFHPVSLLVVKPGDHVTATMHATSKGWKLSFVDDTSTRSVNFNSRYGRSEKFGQAEWFQEDPAPGGSFALQDLPYPTMTSTHFSHVQQNNHAPRGSNLYSQILVASNESVILGPTTFRNDGFTVKPVTGELKQYFADAYRFNRRLTSFLHLLAYTRNNDAHVRGTTVLLADEMTDLISSARRYNSELRTQHWNSAATFALTPLVQSTALLTEELLGWRDLLRQSDFVISTRFLATTKQVSGYAHVEWSVL